MKLIPDFSITISWDNWIFIYTQTISLNESTKMAYEENATIFGKHQTKKGPVQTYLLLSKLSSSTSFRLLMHAAIHISSCLAMNKPANAYYAVD